MKVRQTFSILSAGALCTAGLVSAASGSEGSGVGDLLVSSPAPAGPAVGGVAGACGGCSNAFDDGEQETSIGLTAGGDMVWANPFSTIDGDCTSICGVRVAFGAVAATSAVRAFVYDDPNNDGDPADALLLASVAGVTANESSNTLNEYVFDAPVEVNGGYFVAVSLDHMAGEFPAAIDQTAPQGKSWIGIPSDPNDPLGTGAPFMIDTVPGLEGNWLLRPVGAPATNPCNADTNGDFKVDVQDLSNVILNWASSDPGSDVNNDNVVDVQDLSQVILQWGDCSPDNDDCVTLRKVSDGTHAFTTVGTDLDVTAPDFTCGNAVNDVWFLYVASCNGTVTISTENSLFDTVLEVYSGSACPPTTSVACDDDTIGTTSQVSIDGANNGDEFLIRVGGWMGDAEGLGQLNISCGFLYSCNSTPQSPPNDCCSSNGAGTGPTKIDGAVGESTMAFDNTNAQTDGFDDVSNPCSSSGGDSQIWKDIWYQYNVPADIEQKTAFLTVTICNQAAFDSKMAIYDVPGGGFDCGDPASYTDNLIACNEDCVDSTAFESELTEVLVTPGNSYLVRLGGFSPDATEAMAETGAGMITFRLELPDNDRCDFPTPIMAGESIDYDTSDATIDDNAGGCGNVPDSPGRWFSTVGDGTTYFAQTCGTAYDTRLTVFCFFADVQDCMTDLDECPAAEVFDNCTGINERVSWCTQVGVTYLILVHGDFDQGMGTLTLTSDMTACDDVLCTPPPPCSDPPAQAPIIASALTSPSFGGAGPAGQWNVAVTLVPNAGTATGWEVWCGDIENGIVDIFDEDLNSLGAVNIPVGSMDPNDQSNDLTGLTYDPVMDVVWAQDNTPNAQKLVALNPVTGAATGAQIVYTPTAVNTTGVSYDPTGDGGNGSFFFLELTNDNIHEISRTGVLLNIYDQTCLDEGAGLLGNGSDVTPGGQLEILAGTPGGTGANTVRPLDLVNLQPSEGDIGMTGGDIDAVTGLDNILAIGGIMRDIARSRANPNGVMFAVERASGSVYKIDPTDLP